MYYNLSKEGMPRLNCPERIEIASYWAEWDKVCDFSVPYIKERFGEMPTLSHSCFWDDEQSMVWFTKEMLRNLVQNHPILSIQFGLFHWQIEELASLVAEVKEPRIWLSQNPMPKLDYPDNLRIIHVPDQTYRASVLSNQIPIRYDRNIQDCQYTFACTAYNPTHGKVHLFQVLQALGHLDNAQYSTRGSDKLAFNPDPYHWNGILEPLQKREIGERYRYDLAKNFKALIPTIETSRFVISITENPFYNDYTDNISEKPMWGLITNTPSLCIWNDHEIDYFKSYGFHLPNLERVRQPNETEADAVARWVSHIERLIGIVNDNRRNINWDKDQAQYTAHNQELYRQHYKTIAKELASQRP